MITDVKIWKDIGYTDGSTEIPPVGASLPSPYMEFEGPFNPSKERVFSELKVPVDYLSVFDVGYLQFTLQLNGDHSLTVFAWVDSVVLQSDTEDFPMTIFNFHVDPWRTFNAQAEYGSGFVKRRPSTGADFYQKFPYRYIKEKSYLDLTDKRLMPGEGVDIRIQWWVLIAAQTKNSQGTVTMITYYAYPIGDYSLLNLLRVSKPDKSDAADTLSFGSVISCRFDEFMGINPDTITGAWLIPFNPIREIMTGTGGSDDPIRCSETPTLSSGWEYEKHTHDSLTSGFFKNNSGNNACFMRYVKTLDNPITAKEEEPIYIVDFTSATIGTIPFGMTVTQFSVELSISATTCYCRIEFGKENEGLAYNIPMPALDVNSNSWSSYVYSGQREYDKTQRGYKSLSNMVEGSVSETATGALIGSVVAPGVGTVVGAIAGLTSTFAKGMFEGLVMNDTYQQSEDKLHASQPDAIIISGEAYMLRAHDIVGSVARNKYDNIRLAIMEYDTESQSVISDIKSVQGVSYNAPMEDCTALISAGGPMQISNLIVKGDIPSEAKAWIKKKFADGVRIVARTP